MHLGEASESDRHEESHDLLPIQSFDIFSWSQCAPRRASGYFSAVCRSVTEQEGICAASLRSVIDRG